MEDFMTTPAETQEEAEIIERNARAVIYSARVARRMAKRDAKRGLVVRTMLAFSLVFLAVAALLRAAVPPCIM